MAITKRFPIRFKILATVLIVITAVVSSITFTMANLFHTDKTAYIHDLTSVIALNTSEQVNALLEGYRERLLVYTRIMIDKKLNDEQKSELLRQMIEDYSDFVAVTLYKDGAETASFYGVKPLEKAGLAKEDLVKFHRSNPLPINDFSAGNLFVQNSTINEKLPVFTLASILSAPGDKHSVMVIADINLQRVIDIARQSKVFETSIVDSQGVLLVDKDIKQIVLHRKADWFPSRNELKQQRNMVRTLEFNYRGSDQIGGFARIGSSGLVVGTQIPKSAAYLTSRELLRNLMLLALGLLITSALVSIFWSRRITRPIELLSKATQAVGSGDFNVQVARTSNDEIGDLASSFNQMASELTERERALQFAQSQLIQSEKMAAFGQLGAGIAHEVKNPLAGILGFAQLSLRKTEPESTLHKNLLVIEKETKRCKSIIENLLRFARQERVELSPIDINTVIDDAAAIVDHQLGINQIRLEKQLAENLPPIMGNANQIQQVLMNLMINAQQAMDKQPGRIRLVSACLGSDSVELRVVDDGPGMNDDVKAKIFEPFFTTKAAGSGTGLGLSVSYGIIKDHNGEIRVESVPGEGTTFIIALPVAADAGNKFESIHEKGLEA